jgi:opacity protein-like surface antigen
MYLQNKMVANTFKTFLLLLIISIATFTTVFAQDHYITLGIGNTALSSDTYDYVEKKYQYKFNKNVINFNCDIGKHINEKLDLGLRFVTTGKFTHRYNGPVEISIDPAIDDKLGKVSTYQNIKSKILLVHGKYNYNPTIFSSAIDIYTRGGIGLAFNISSDYSRKITDNVGERMKILYPGDSKSNLALSLGGGIEKKVDNMSFILGYDCYRIGSFQTENRAIINDLSSGTVIVYKGTNDIVGKRLKPHNIVIHTMNISFGINF